MYTLYLVLGAIWYILLAIGMWKMFEKAGVAGWKGIVPIYNFYLLFKICWQDKMFWIWIVLEILTGIFYYYGYGSMLLYYLAMACSIIGGIMIAVLYYNLSIAYGHGLGFFLGLYFLTPLFIMIIGFGSSKFAGNRYNHAFA